MKRLIKKASLAFIFLQVLFLNQAYANEAKGAEYLAAFFILIAITPALVALIILLTNLRHLGRALIFVSAIWLAYFGIITKFKIFTDFPGFINELILNFQFDISLIAWVPLTLILLLTIILFVLENYYPKENQE